MPKIVIQISAAGSLGREMNECDLERAKERHLTEAKRLQDDAIDIGINIDTIQRRVERLREQLRKDEHRPGFNFIENINEMK